MKLYCERTTRHFCRRRRGFSLVELMVVIVIIGLLASVVTFSVRSYLISAKQNVAKLEISKMMQALETFYTTYDRFPTNEEGLLVLSQANDEFADGIIGNVPKDPWGFEYEYNHPGRQDAFDIICYGADNREGGSGADKDIRSDELTNR